MSDEMMRQLQREAILGDEVALDRLVRLAEIHGDLSLVPADLLWQWKIDKNYRDVHQGILPIPDFEAIKTAPLNRARHFRRFYFPNGYGVSVAWDAYNPIPGLAPRLPVEFSREQIEAMPILYPHPYPWETFYQSSIREQGYELKSFYPDYYGEMLSSKHCLARGMGAGLGFQYRDRYANRFTRHDPQVLINFLREISDFEPTPYR